MKWSYLLPRKTFMLLPSVSTSRTRSASASAAGPPTSSTLICFMAISSRIFMLPTHVRSERDVPVPPPAVLRRGERLGDLPPGLTGRDHLVDDADVHGPLYATRDLLLLLDQLGPQLLTLRV